MKKFFLSIAACFCLIISSRAQYYKLGLQLTKGNTYYYLTTANVTVTQSINNRKITNHSNVAGRIAFTVTAVRDSLYDMLVKYESLQLKLETPAGIISYNSETPLANGGSGVFSAFKNQQFTAVLSKACNLSKLQGITTIIEKIIANTSNLNTDEKANIKSVLLQTVGEGAFKSNFEIGTAIFPSVAVKKGVLWVSDGTLAGANPADIHTVYELRDITETFYQIHTTSAIKYPDRNIFKTVNGMQVRNNQEGFMTGDIVIDKNTGWVKQSSINQNIKGSTEIKDSPQVPGGKIIPMEMQADITITDIH